MVYRVDYNLQGTNFRIWLLLKIFRILCYGFLLYLLFILLSCAIYFIITLQYPKLALQGKMHVCDIRRPKI